MAEALLSGYKAAEAAIVFSGTRTLVSLADEEWTHLSNEIDNSTNKYILVDLRIVLGSAAYTGTDSGIELYLVPSVDGTTYPTWTGDGIVDEQENGQFFVGFAPTTGATEAQNMVIRSITLPNGKYKWGVRNRTNVALPASGSTIYWRPHGFSTA